MGSIVTWGLGPGLTVPTDWVVTVETHDDDADLPLDTWRLTFSPAVVVNAAVRCLDVYVVTPVDPEVDARERLRVLAVDPGTSTSTTTVLLQLEEQVQGAQYTLDIETWRLA